MQSAVKLYSAYGERPDNPGLDFHENDGMTRQSFRDECNVNMIMDRFIATGVFPLPKLQPRYGSLIGLDLHDLMDQVADAGEAFDALPAKLRDRFNNDPQQFVEFVLDPTNADELIRMGLAEAKPAQQGEGSTGEGKPPTSSPSEPEQGKKTVAPDKPGTT